MLKHVHTFSGHQNPVYALGNSNLNGNFFSAGNDKGIVEWSLQKMAFVKVKTPAQSSVYALHVNGNKLFIGERSGLLSIYDLTEERLLASVNAHAKPIFDIKTISSKNEVLTASEDGWVAVWSLHTFKEIYRFPVTRDTVRCIAISPDETEIALGCKDNSIYIYDLSDFSLKQRLNDHSAAITSLAYHPNGDYLISGSRDAQLKVWSIPNLELLHTIPAHLFSVYQIAFHPTLPYFATCSQDKSIKLWDSKNFKLYKILSLEKNGIGHSHSVNKISWTPDGNQLISTGDDRKVMVWNFDENS